MLVYNGIMKNLILKAMKELSLKELILIISGKQHLIVELCLKLLLLVIRKLFGRSLLNSVNTRV